MTAITKHLGRIPIRWPRFVADTIAFAVEKPVTLILVRRPFINPLRWLNYLYGHLSW